MLRKTKRALVSMGITFFVFLGIALWLNTFSYLNFNPEFGFLKLKQEAVATGWYLPAFYSHIFVGGLVLTVGFFQFSKKMRKKLPKVHRFLGYIYFFGILLFAGPGGMVMSFFVNRGGIVFMSFLLQCALWFFFTYVAFRKIMERKIVEHEHWTMRSFSLTLAAITLRLYIFAGSYFIDLNSSSAYGTFAFLSWVPNIIVAELLIQRKSSARLARSF
jgi:hypothetical protein